MAVLWLYHHPCPLYFHYSIRKILLQTGFSQFIRAHQWSLHSHCCAVFQYFLFGFRYSCSGVCAGLSDGNHSENFHCPDADFIIYLKHLYINKNLRKREPFSFPFLFILLLKNIYKALGYEKTSSLLKRKISKDLKNDVYIEAVMNILKGVE